MEKPLTKGVIFRSPIGGQGYFSNTLYALEQKGHKEWY